MSFSRREHINKIEAKVSLLCLSYVRAIRRPSFHPVADPASRGRTPSISSVEMYRLPKGHDKRNIWSSSTSSACRYTRCVSNYYTYF